MVAFAQLNIWNGYYLQLFCSTCHPGHWRLLTAGLPEEKCEVVTAGHQHLLTHHLTISSYSKTLTTLTKVTFMTEL